jgi:hypothetical protein
MTPAERRAYLSRPAPWWVEKTTSILPSEIPDWALKLAIITAIVLMLAH